MLPELNISNLIYFISLTDFTANSNLVYFDRVTTSVVENKYSFHQTRPMALIYQGFISSNQPS